MAPRIAYQAREFSRTKILEQYERHVSHCWSGLYTAMDSRCRGANGEVGGEAGDEYALFCDFPKELRRFRGRKGGILRNWSIALERLKRNIEEY